MNGMRKVLGLLMVMMLAAFALPANAQKTFYITPPSSLPIATQQIQVTFTNTGNSNFNSLELDVQSGNLVINPTGASLSKGNGTFVYLSNKTIQFTNISPGVKDSVTVSLNVTTTNATCSASTVQWFAHAWTGSPTNPSQTFTLTPLPQNTTIGAPTCTLSFIAQPTSATVGTNITSVPYNISGTPPVQVGLFNGNTRDTTFSGPVSLAVKTGTGGGGGGVLTVGTPPTFSSGVASFSSLSINASGTNYQLTASSGAYSPVDSTPFWITTAAGTVGCTNDNNYIGQGTIDPNLAYVDLNQASSGQYGIRRGPNTDDQTGANCVLVGANLTVDATNNAHFTYDKTFGQQAAFKYTIVWNEVPVDGPSSPTASWTGSRPIFSWGIDNPTPGGLPDYVPALACADDDLALPPSTLMPLIPNVAPFNTVANTRPQYQVGQRAKMCIAQHAWTSNGRAPDPVTGTIQVIYWDKVVDEADGWVGLP